jgi:hypothetical protein
VISCHRHWRRGPADVRFEPPVDRYRYNEPLRKRERHLHFDIPALCHAIASSIGSTDVTSLLKIAEGGFNRIFQATCSDGRQVLARLPYPSTAPKHYTVASEVATMEYLQLNQIPVPRVYGWSSTTSNTVGAEYIIMEKLDGMTVGDIWFALSFKERYKVVEQIVQLEKKLFSLQLPANGSIYFPHDLSEHERSQSFLLSVQGHEFCIGPMAHYSWWHGERGLLECDRGPCKSYSTDKHPGLTSQGTIQIAFSLLSESENSSGRRGSQSRACTLNDSTVKCTDSKRCRRRLISTPSTSTWS